MRELLLVADDSEDLRRIFQAALANAGYAVVTARNGAEALRLARETLPSLVLLDLAMPVVDGIGVIEELKRSERTASIPVVAVTGYDVVAEELRKLGFLGVLRKPVSPRFLVEAVERARAAAASGSGWVELRARARGDAIARVRPLDARAWDRIRERLARMLGKARN